MSWRPQESFEAAEAVRTEEMPLWFYLPLHPTAHLSPSQRTAFIAGLERTFPADSP